MISLDIDESKKQARGPTTAARYAAVDEDIIIPLLVRRSCHLPGNGWCQDWMQYLSNNHMLVGICWHHPLHPLETWERVLAMTGSVSFGLAATTCAYLWENTIDHMTRPVFVLPYSLYTSEDTTTLTVITQGNLLLWSCGSLGHVIFDLVIWNIMACACCHPGGRFGNWNIADKFRNCGSFLLVPVVLGLMVLAGWAVLTRASQQTEQQAQDQYEQDLQEQQQQQQDDNINNNNMNNYIFTDDEIDWQDIEGVESFSFLSEYFIELALAWFVYYLVIRTVIFSGILGCNGRLPFLGGRPRDVRLFQESLQESGGQPYHAGWTS